MSILNSIVLYRRENKKKKRTKVVEEKRFKFKLMLIVFYDIHILAIENLFYNIPLIVHHGQGTSYKKPDLNSCDFLMLSRLHLAFKSLNLNQACYLLPSLHFYLSSEHLFYAIESNEQKNMSACNYFVVAA